MAFEANYQEITLNQIRLREVVTEVTEGDVIVPDVQGDIGKVLQVKTSCAIESTERNGERMTLHGMVYADILYLPAEGTGMEAIHTTLPFQHTFRVDGEKVFVEATAEQGETSYYLYHSRKLNLKVTVFIKKEISEDCTCRVLTDGGADCHTEMKQITVPCLTEHLCLDQVLAIREQTELNGSLPDIHHILFCEGKIREPQVRLMTNKAMIKGEIVLSFFYYSIEETAEYAEHVIPFTEVVDAMGVTEEMDSEFSIILSGLQMKVDEDSDGDMRQLFMDAKLFVQIRAWQTQNTELIEDLFCTDYPLECVHDTLYYSEEQPVSSKEIEIRESLFCEEQPSVSKIYLLEPSVLCHSVSCEEKTTVEGKCCINLLYQSPEGEYCTLSKELPFSQELEGELNRGDVHLSCGRFSYHLLSAGEVEIRGVIYIEGTAVKVVNIPCVLQAEVIENKECNETRPSLVIYFVQKGDTLWNIAKRYSVTLDSIIKANQLTDTNLAIGQKIFIPR